MDSQRPAKRTRQACDPCRRKKGKCSGDRPVCSTCHRLRQPCSYPIEPAQIQYHEPTEQPARPVLPETPTNPGSAMRWEDRMESLESTLSDVLQTLRQGPGSVPRAPVLRDSPGFHGERAHRAIRTNSITPSLSDFIVDSIALNRTDLAVWVQVEAVAELYLKYCDCQPLTLFDADGFVESLRTRDDEVILGVLALGLRFSHSTAYHRHKHDSSREFAKLAQSLVMSRVANGRVALSTLQTLCVLALYQFHDGSAELSLSLISLAATLGQGAGLQKDAHNTLEGQELEERRRCFWSITMLRRILGAERSTYDVADTKLPAYPPSVSSPPHSALRTSSNEGSEEWVREHGIMVLVFQLSDVWSKTMSYVRSCLSSHQPTPPWSTSSKYSEVLSSAMCLGQHSFHTYGKIKLGEMTAENLDRSRNYWAPWLLSRFMYHTNLCLLNHPLLVTLQLQGRKQDSELFRQQTSFYVSQHTTWILHFIAFIESREFRVSDPTIGYCAAVAATIELQLSFSVDESLGREKKRNFHTCLSFIQKLAGEWPSMGRLVSKLQDLTEAMTVSYESNLSSAGKNIFVDLSKISDILDYATSSSHYGLEAPEQRIYASSLLPAVPPPGLQWTKLSRIPPVDYPDPSSTADRATAAETLGTLRTGPVNPNQTRSSQPPTDVVLPIADELMLPADQFFNGISQDVDNWWGAYGFIDPNLAMLS